MINLPARFNSTNVKSSLVSNKWNFITPILVYDLTASIRARGALLWRTLVEGGGEAMWGKGEQHSPHIAFPHQGSPQ